MVLAVHVALNLAFLTSGKMGGLEIYARRLTESLSRRNDILLTLLLPRSEAHAWTELGRVLPLPVDPRRRTQWVRADHVHVPRAAARVGADVLHSLASTGPLAGRTPRVVTVHDLHYRTQPEAHFGLRGLGMRVLVPAAARRSRRIVVPSSATAADVERLLGVARERIDVIPEAPGHPPRPAARSRAEVRGELGAMDDPLLLTVSAKRPHKNLARLIRAVARLEPGRRPLLVMPGYATPYECELRTLAEELGVAEHMRFLGWLSDQELEDLYRSADAFVFPSLSEGFGLPVLEAMARGVPVATSGRTSLAEVAGEAALLFDPDDEGSIADAIDRLLHEEGLSARLAGAGLGRAARFTWDAAAELTVASYRRALAER